MQACIGTVDDVDVPALIRIHIVGLNARRTVDNTFDCRASKIGVGCRVGNIKTHFPRSKRITDIYRPHSCSEVRYEHDLLVEWRTKILIGGMWTEATSTLTEVKRTA